MSEIPKYDLIRNFLTSYGNLEVKEKKDNDYHFVFYVWFSGTKYKPIVLRIGYLKEAINDLEILVIGFNWRPSPHPVTESVMISPIRTKRFVSGLRRVIDLKKYKIRFYPSEQNFDSVSINTFLKINSVNRDNLYRKIIDVWVQYLNVLRQIEKASGRKELSNPSDYI